MRAWMRLSAFLLCFLSLFLCVLDGLIGVVSVSFFLFRICSLFLCRALFLIVLSFSLSSSLSLSLRPHTTHNDTTPTRVGALGLGLVSASEIPSRSFNQGSRRRMSLTHSRANLLAKKASAGSDSLKVGSWSKKSKQESLNQSTSNGGSNQGKGKEGGKAITGKERRKRSGSNMSNSSSHSKRGSSKLRKSPPLLSQPPSSPISQSASGKRTSRQVRMLIYPIAVRLLPRFFLFLLSLCLFILLFPFFSSLFSPLPCFPLFLVFTSSLFSLLPFFPFPSPDVLLLLFFPFVHLCQLGLLFLPLFPRLLRFFWVLLLSLYVPPFFPSPRTPTLPFLIL